MAKFKPGDWVEIDFQKRSPIGTTATQKYVRDEINNRIGPGPWEVKCITECFVSGCEQMVCLSAGSYFGTRFKLTKPTTNSTNLRLLRKK